jgi:hypothetical protein
VECIPPLCLPPKHGGNGLAHSGDLAGSTPAVHTIFRHTERHSMKRVAVLLAALVATSAMALEDVHAPFNTNKNFTNVTQIRWISVDSSQLQERCNIESRKRGMTNFTVSVEACSFWDKEGRADVCTIVTPRVTNMHTLGHEVRHCFQGEWHR